MKVPFSTPLLDIDGKQMEAVLDPAGAMTRLTLGNTAVSLLTRPSPGDDRLTGEQKFDLFRLALHIKERPDSDFSLGDVNKIKERIGIAGTQMIIGRCWAILDPPPKDEEAS